LTKARKDCIAPRRRTLRARAAQPSRWSLEDSCQPAVERANTTANFRLNAVYSGVAHLVGIYPLVEVDNRNWAGDATKTWPKHLGVFDFIKHSGQLGLDGPMHYARPWLVVPVPSCLPWARLEVAAAWGLVRRTAICAAEEA